MDPAQFWYQSGSRRAVSGNSLRFNGAQGLARTPATAGNRKTWTWSGWVKRSAIDSNRYMVLSAGTASTSNNIEFNNNSIDVYYYLGGYTWRVLTAAVYRDTSAWYHVVVAVDTTQATASNRVRIYVNGSEATAFSIASYPSQNADGLINSTYAHNISGFSGSSGFYFNGYLAEVNFVDGQALLPTTFGEFDANGVWIPKANVIAAGGFGVNGFALNFDAKNFNTSALKWADQSGKGNDFTANWNCQTGLLAIITDILFDGPQVNASQYNMLSPGGAAGSMSTNTFWSKGGSWHVSRYGSVKLPDSGKWYFEWHCWNPSLTQGETVYGFAGRSFNNILTASLYIGADSDSVGWYASSGIGTAKWWYNSVNTATGPSQTGSSIEQFRVGIAVDCDQATPVARLFIKINNITWSEQTSQTIPRSLVTSGLWPASSIYNGNHSLVWGAVTPDNPFPAANGYNQLYASLMPVATIPNTITGTFTGNSSADGPFVYTGCIPGRIQYGTVDVTYGNRLPNNDVDFLCNGFKVRSATSNAGIVNYTVTTTHSDGEYSGRKVPFGGSNVSPATACSN